MSKLEFTSKVLSEISIENLNEKVAFFKKALFNLRFQKVVGELTDPNRFKKVRKDIARLNSELTKRRLVGAKSDA